MGGDDYDTPVFLIKAEGADGGPEHKEAQPELSDQELLAGEEIILPLLSSAEVSTKLVALQADNDTVTPIAQLNDDSFSYTVNMERIMDLRHLTIIQCIITNRRAKLLSLFRFCSITCSHEAGDALRTVI